MTSPDLSTLAPAAPCASAPDDFVLPPGVVFSSDPDCAWAWTRLLNLAFDFESEQEESS